MKFTQSLTTWLAIRSLGKKQKTQEFYRGVYNIILKNWTQSDLPVSEIGADEILAFALTVNNQCASRWNAIVGAMRYIFPNQKLLKRRPVPIRAFNPPGQSQFQTLLTVIDAMSRTKASLIVRFFYMTGMRKNEGYGLLKTDIHAHGIHVRSELCKNSKDRWVPIFPGLHAVIDRLFKSNDDVFLLPQQNIRKALELACSRAGLPRMSYHCLRHSFTTRCIESGVDIPTVARWLGHSDGGSILAKRYFHLIDEHSRRMADRVKIAA